MDVCRLIQVALLSWFFLLMILFTCWSSFGGAVIELLFALLSLAVPSGGSHLLRTFGVSCCQLGVGVGVATTDCWRRRPPDLLRSTRLMLLLFVYGPLVLVFSGWALDEAFGLDWEFDLMWDLPMVWILMEGVLPPSSIT